MNKVKLRWTILLAFVALAAVLLGVILCVPYGGRASAINYAPTTIFSQGTGGDVGASEAGTEETSFIQFSFRDDGKVYYRRDLALKWFVSAIEKAPEEEEGSGGAESTAFTPAEGDPYDAGKVQYLTMTFAFAPAEVSTTLVESVQKNVCPRCGATFDADATECSDPDCGFTTGDVVFFDRYEMIFESAEENISKEAKATNSVLFVAQEDGSVKVGVRNAEWHNKYDDEEDDAEGGDADADIADFITISAGNMAEDMVLSFGEAESGAPGEFTVALAVGGGDAQALGNFTNVGGNYLEYRSSASSTPNTPITFTASLAEPPAAPEGKTYNKISQQVIMKALNGQTFEVKDGRVDDNAPAVLVLNEEVFGFTLGQRYSLTTEAIDVCDDSVSVVRSFYMLRTEKDDPTANHIPADEDYGELTTSKYFLPAEDGGANEEQYVSIRYILRDGRFGSDSDYGYVYLSWYAAKNFVKTFADATGENKLDMILVESAEHRAASADPSAYKPVGPYYNGVEADMIGNRNTVDGTTLGPAVTNFNEDLAAVASDEKTSAGNGAYIYLPSFRGLISSDYADYRNLRFSISYKKENSSTSPSTETSLRYNNLRFQIDLEGHYSFKVIASDAAGNPMKYYVDGELVEVTTTNVWDIDEIPTFEFDVDYKGADVTEPGELDAASRGTSYSLEEFDIVDLGNNIKEYTLFYFNPDKITGEGDLAVPTYSEFVENAKTYASETYKDCLEEIMEFNSEITEDDEAWERTDNDYHWDPDSSLSFVPQKSGFYVLRLTYYDLSDESKMEQGAPVPQDFYEIVEVRNPYDYIPAKSDWLANNVTSVVLFSISAVLAVIIVVLFVVKPSDKKVEEVDLGSLKGKKNKKDTK